MTRPLLLAAMALAVTFGAPGAAHAQGIHRVPTPADVAPGANWPPVDRRYFLLPAKDQLYRGSCAVFASLAAMEYFPGVPKLSEAYAYSILKEAGDLEFDGATFERLKTFLEQNPMLAARLADEKIPYDSIGQFAFNAGKENEVEIARRFNRLKGKQAELMRPEAIYQASKIQVFRKESITKDWLMSALNDGPVVAGLLIDASAWEKAPNGEISNPAGYLSKLLDQTSSKAGHAVLLVNYTQDGYIVFRNSWSSRWGDHGYGYMSWDYALGHIAEAMRIGRVAASPRTLGFQPEQFDVKGNAIRRWEKDPSGRPIEQGFAVYLSLILLSNWTSGGGITSVTYDLYRPGSNTAGRQWLGSVEGTDPETNFYKGINVSGNEHSFEVCVSLHHWDKSVNSGCTSLPEVLTWSDSPILEAPRK